MGFIFAIIAGISMSLQGVFNTRASEKIGSFETNILVQGSALILAVFILLILRSNNFSQIKNVNKLYLSGGILAVIITFTVMEGIKRIGVTTAISTILIAQITSAALIDCFGFFNTSCIKFSLPKYMGLAAMIAGILLFRYKD